MIERIVEWVTPVFAEWGLLLVFLATFLETSAFLGLIVPGETVVILGGILANPTFRGEFTEAGSLEITIQQVIVVAIVGVIAGDQAGYMIGRVGGRKLAHRWKRLLRPERLAAAEAYYRQHGGKTVFLGRFTPFLRSLGAMVAGMSRMRYWRFTLWDLAGAILWGIGIPMVGYIFGRYGTASIKAIDRFLKAPGFALLALLTIGMFIYWRRRKKERELAGDSWRREEAAAGKSRKPNVG
ncbi:MAG TPA: DedA family protein [Actinomycetota bacterium]|nr:DedA family protein [Actinomycetota bacterium]